MCLIVKIVTVKPAIIAPTWPIWSARWSSFSCKGVSSFSTRSDIIVYVEQDESNKKKETYYSNKRKQSRRRGRERKRRRGEGEEEGEEGDRHDLYNKIWIIYLSMEAVLSDSYNQHRSVPFQYLSAADQKRILFMVLGNRIGLSVHYWFIQKNSMS